MTSCQSLLLEPDHVLVKALTQFRVQETIKKQQCNLYANSKDDTTSDKTDIEKMRKTMLIGSVAPYSYDIGNQTDFVTEENRLWKMSHGIRPKEEQNVQQEMGG